MVSFNQRVQVQSEPDIDAAIFDVSHFVRQTYGERGLQQEILQLFLTQIGDLRRALEARQFLVSWVYLTHTLKGASAAVGATGLMQMAVRWEAEPTPADDGTFRALLDEFDSHCSAFRLAAAAFMA
ncbi:MAG: Hpt domain-containing protein [Proteobacteria bacterium]|nr:Hpt domain-containing protein [Pseudomonadota bacterium]